jgi:hypothetical protein
VRFPQLVAEARPLPDGLPAGVTELIGACLEKRPGDRISAAELVDGLEPLVATLPRKLVLGRRGARGW